MRTEPLGGTRITILSPSAEQLEGMLSRAGYRRVSRAERPGEVLPRGPEGPLDLLILDLASASSVYISRVLDAAADERRPAVLVLADELPVELRERILALPASDFMSKPVDGTELLLRVRNLLRTRWLWGRLRRHAEGERLLRDHSEELEEARLELLERLAWAVEYKDDESGQHPRRVGARAGRIAEALGLDVEETERIRLAAPLHDVGNIAIPDAILLKPEPLELWEAELMRSHTLVGSQLLGGSSSPVLQVAEAIALSHHERWDGGGYPEGLMAESIPLPARIVAVADTFDALSYDRPYRDAWPAEKATEEIRRNAGRHFDPRVVRAFLDDVLPALRAAEEGEEEDEGARHMA